MLESCMKTYDSGCSVCQVDVYWTADSTFLTRFRTPSVPTSGNDGTQLNREFKTIPLCIDEVHWSGSRSTAPRVDKYIKKELFQQ